MYTTIEVAIIATLLLYVTVIAINSVHQCSSINHAMYGNH